MLKELNMGHQAGLIYIYIFCLAPLAFSLIRPSRAEQETPSTVLGDPC